MAKRRKGFGDGKKIEKREKAGACLQCHASQSKGDFVFREQVK